MLINAQIYKGKYLALSIVDIGKTIPQSYQEAGFDLSTDSEAFEYILSGISSTRDSTRGYGLNSNINIISSALKGSIVIVSGSAAVSKIQEDNPKIFNLGDSNLYFGGTFINILFEIPDKELDLDPYNYIGKKKIYKD